MVFDDHVRESLRLLISYSPEDQDLKDQLVRHLRVLARFGRIELWSADSVLAGEDWRRQVEASLDRADVALLLISAGFLVSESLQDVEIPRLFNRRARGGLRIIPVLLRSCHWECVPWLQHLAMLPKGGSAVASFEHDARDRVLVEIVREIEQASNKPAEEQAIRGGDLRHSRGHENALEGTSFPGDYIAERKVANVGMSVVYRARRPSTDQTVFIRVFRPRVFQEPRSLDAFHKWAAALQKIRQANCARVIDTGILEGMPYLMTEEVRGRFLSSIFQGDDLLTPVDAARLAHQLLGALAEVHQAGLIHGTLCPSDIVLAPDHRGERWATLLDFGVPESITDGGGDRLARWSFLVPAYAAPEQYGGLSDSRVDLYACGVILFRAITGKLPFGGRRLEKTITSEALSSPQMAVLADDVRKEVTRIVVRALEADPTERFQSASEFAGDLRTLLDRTTSPK